jgi:hypothetical protein
VDSEYYRFCTPDQHTIAIKAKIVEFLNSNEQLLNDLKKLTRELSDKFGSFWGSSDGTKLSTIMSLVFGATPSPLLKSEFVTHLLKVHVAVPTHECFDALGPIVVALTLGA